SSLPDFLERRFLRKQGKPDSLPYICTIVGADVTSSRLINATLRNTTNQGTSKPFSDAAFPKTDTSGLIPGLSLRRRQWLFNELALLTRWHAIWIRAVGKVGNPLWRRTTDGGSDMEAALPMIPTPRTLIADDHPDVLAALRMLLRNEGWQTEAATSPAEVIEAVSARDFDLVLMDLNYARDTTSGQEGLDLIARIRALDSALPVVAMTAWASIELAVEAMRRGVADFVQKPWENARLLRILRDQIMAGRARRREQRLKATRDRELAAAEEIQQSLLPRHMPVLKKVGLDVAWRPAGPVSGDYFDVIQFDERRAALCVGDVMGKGMPAALVMSNLQALVKAFATAAAPPQRLCEQINRAVCGNLPEGKYITFFYG